MTRVAFPDGTHVDFPDTMGDDEINAAAAKVWNEQLAPKTSTASANPSTAIAPASTPAPVPSTAGGLGGQTYLSARDPTLSERLSDITGVSPQHWADTIYNLKAPARVIEGMKQPFQGTVQGLMHGASWLASAGGYAPNSLSDFLGSTASGVDAQLARERERQQTEAAAAGIEPGAPDYARIAGNAISPMTLATAQLGAPAQGANILARLAAGARTGAALGAEQPVYGGDFASEKESQALEGAAAGAGTEAVAGAVAPWATEQARYLADRYGIRVPFLTTMGPAAHRFEEISQSVPGSGMAVRHQFNNANEDLVRAATNETLEPLAPYGFGQRVGAADEPGRALADVRRNAITQSYDAVIPRLRGEMDQDFQNDIAGIRAGLPVRVRADFDDAMDRHVFSKAASPAPGQPIASLNGRDAKFADMDLRDEATRRIQKPGNADDYYLGEALGDARAALRDMWTRHSAPEDIAQLNATDLAYRRNMILHKAETSSAAPEGVFGPTQLWQAVKSEDPTLGKRALATGTAQLQDLAETAKTVLGKTVADSGTPERAALMGVVHGAAAGGGLAAGGVALGVTPYMLGGLGTHALAYTNTGQAMLRALAAGGAAPREGLAGFMRTVAAPGIAGYAAGQNRPKSVREWRAQAAQGGY